VRIEVIFLVQQPDIALCPPPVLYPWLGHIDRIITDLDDHLPRGRLDDARDYPGESCFASPALSDDPEYLLLLDIETHPIHRPYDSPVYRDISLEYIPGDDDVPSKFRNLEFFGIGETGHEGADDLLRRPKCRDLPLGKEHGTVSHFTDDLGKV